MKQSQLVASALVGVLLGACADRMVADEEDQAYIAATIHYETGEGAFYRSIRVVDPEHGVTAASPELNEETWGTLCSLSPSEAIRRLDTSPEDPAHKNENLSQGTFDPALGAFGLQEAKTRDIRVESAMNEAVTRLCEGV